MHSPKSNETGTSRRIQKDRRGQNNENKLLRSFSFKRRRSVQNVDDKNMSDLSRNRNKEEETKAFSSETCSKSVGRCNNPRKKSIGYNTESSTEKERTRSAQNDVIRKEIRTKHESKSDSRRSDGISTSLTNMLQSTNETLQRAFTPFRRRHTMNTMGEEKHVGDMTTKPQSDKLIESYRKEGTISNEKKKRSITPHRKHEISIETENGFGRSSTPHRADGACTDPAEKTTEKKKQNERDIKYSEDRSIRRSEQQLQSNPPGERGRSLKQEAKNRRNLSLHRQKSKRDTGYDDPRKWKRSPTPPRKKSQTRITKTFKACLPDEKAIQTNPVSEERRQSLIKQQSAELLRQKSQRCISAKSEESPSGVHRKALIKQKYAALSRQKSKRNIADNLPSDGRDQIVENQASSTLLRQRSQKEICCEGDKAQQLAKQSSVISAGETDHRVQKENVKSDAETKSKPKKISERDSRTSKCKKRLGDSDSNHSPVSTAVSLDGQQMPTNVPHEVIISTGSHCRPKKKVSSEQIASFRKSKSCRDLDMEAETTDRPVLPKSLSVNKIGRMTAEASLIQQPSKSATHRRQRTMTPHRQRGGDKTKESSPSDVRSASAGRATRLGMSKQKSFSRSQRRLSKAGDSSNIT